MAALITLCNQALGEVAADQIASLNENSIESRECVRFAQPLLDEIADWNEWPFRNTRVVLASLVNDRTAEWLYRYALPSDAASVIAIRSVEEAASYLPEYGPYAMPSQDRMPNAWQIEGSSLYSNVETATLVYSRSSLDAGDLPPLLQRAFVLELAARLAWPVKKDKDLRKILRQEAELAKSRAISDERNKSPQTPPRYVSEVEYARAGIGV